MKYTGTRRNFLKKSALSAFSLALGMDVVYGHRAPVGWVPVGLPGKRDGLTILNDRPVNAETPPHLLDDALTPNDLFFVRNNGLPPERVDVNNWTLTIEGEAAVNRRVFTLRELQRDFETVTLSLTLECGGNGRKEFNPPAKGNQWSTGAVGCAAWTGVRLRDVLRAVGVGPAAVYLGYYGEDTHLSGDPEKVVISRGVPIAKALEAESLIAWEMNGQALPLLNGYPLRLVFGGYPASCSGKWLSRLVLRDRVHDGPKMTGQSYRVPCKPVAPGTKVPDEEMCIIESMPVKSILTYPRTGATLPLGKTLPVRGKAWTSTARIERVDYSIDFGASWQSCTVQPGVNRYAWQSFAGRVRFPKPGYYEVWARATDDTGAAQPMLLPGWNPRGYLNNACHRIAIQVTSS